MERVVYLLGAGFSAPLGLPVMSNFYFKSQDMFVQDPIRYKHFKRVFETIAKISVGKNYFETNVFNIEDVLSILEMTDYLKGNRLRKEFIRYIVDVIEYYTPEYQKYPLDANVTWDNHLLGSKNDMHHYAVFVCGLLNANFRKDQLSDAFGNKLVTCTTDANRDVEYSVVSLNYDRVLESFTDHVPKVFDAPDRPWPKFRRPGEVPVPGATPLEQRQAPLAKLHGSVDSGQIVPPTWSKGVIRSVSEDWRMAHDALSQATQIRILGYSLPTADAYVKYLFKSAVISGDRRLRKIDVICRDKWGDVKARYDEFIKFENYEFVPGDIRYYLECQHQVNHDPDYSRRVQARSIGWKFDKLEEGHRRFMIQSSP